MLDRSVPKTRKRGKSAPLLIDASLSLINQTGAHFIAQVLVEHFGESAVVRRWRLLGMPLPGGVPRKILGRLMIRELLYASRSNWLRWPEQRGLQKRLFLDPLYVLRSKLEHSDLVLCHDVGPVSHPELYDEGTCSLYQLAYERMSSAAPGVVFVSETSKDAFVDLYGNGFRRLEVIPLYLRTGLGVAEPAPVEGVRTPFFLTVGALEKRKNQTSAIRAFAESGLSDAGYSYILCGARGDAADQVTRLVQKTAGVHLLGYITDQELLWLYRNAQAFVLPSLLEGFGMPALEAARYGLIPLLSQDSALREAVGDLGFAADPRSISSLAEGMKTIANLPLSEREPLRDRLLVHAQKSTEERFLDSWSSLLKSELEAS